MAQQSSRLQRLLTLLDTGSTQATRFTAARQIGEIAKSHPQDLNSLLSKVSQYLRSRNWDTRVAAAHAIGAIAENVKHTSLTELYSCVETKMAEAGISGAVEDVVAGPAFHPKIVSGVSFRSFDINKVLDFGALLASEGQEYDIGSDSTKNPRERLARQKQNLRRRLGLDVCEQFMDVNEMIRDEDLVVHKFNSHGNGIAHQLYMSQSVHNIKQYVSNMVPGFKSRRPSARELNLLKRKAKINSKDQGKGWSKDGDAEVSFSQDTPSPKGFCPDSASSNKLFTDSILDEDSSYYEGDGGWPFHSFVEQLILDMFDPVWEVRHGSVMALREILTHQGACAEVFMPDLSCDGASFYESKDAVNANTIKREREIDLNMQVPADESEPNFKRPRLEDASSTMMGTVISSSKDHNFDMHTNVEDRGWNLPAGQATVESNVGHVKVEPQSFPDGIWHLHKEAVDVAELKGNCGYKGSMENIDVLKNIPENCELMNLVKLARHSWLKNCEFLQECAIRFLCVLSLDRFGDYVSDQVVAPVRETCAQALGVVLKYMHPTLVHETLNILLQMQRRPEWEIRHGSLLGIKYLVAVRQEMLHDLLGCVIPACKAGLEDPDDDVRAVAADALIPAATAIVSLNGQTLHSIVMILWDILLDLDDLSPSTSSVMNLLAEIYSQEQMIQMFGALTSKEKQEFDLNEIGRVDDLGEGLGSQENPYMLSTLAPRLWPFMRHSITSVRYSAIRTLERLLEARYKMNILDSSTSSFWPSFILGDTIRIVFQNLLLESNEDILQCSERVWRILVQCPVEDLEAAANSNFSSWIELTSTPFGSPLDATKMFWPVALPRKSHFRAAAKMRAVKLENDTFRNIALDSAKFSTLQEKNGDGSTNPVKIIVGADMEMSVTHTRVVTATALGILASKLHEGSMQYVVDPLWKAVTSLSGVQRQVASLVLISWFKEIKSRKISGSDGVMPGFSSDFKKWLLDLLACTNPAFPTKDSCLPYAELSRTYAKMRNEASQLFRAVESSGLFNNLLSTINIDLESLSVDNAMNFASKLPMLNNDTAAEESVGRNIVDELESLKQRLLTTAGYLKCVQSNLHVTVSALVAAAVVWMSELPAKLNPIILPLMASIKREQEEILQNKAAEALAELVCHCIVRRPGPNDKLIKNLCSLTCMDPCETPQAGVLSSIEKIEDQDLLSFGSSTGKQKSKVHVLTSGDDRSKVEGFISRRGSELALKHLCEKFCALLFDKIPKLWDCLTEILKPCGVEGLTQEDEKHITQVIESIKDPQILINNIQVVRSIAPRLDVALRPKLLTLLPCIFNCVRHSHIAVRLAASRCITSMAKSMTENVMAAVIENVVPMLGNMTSVDARQGAGMLVSLLVQGLGVELVPYAPLLVVPLLRCMSDCDHSVRQSVTHSFAALVPLLPLARGLTPPVGLTESLSRNKEDAQFLEQLVDNSHIDDYKLSIELKVTLRRYQQEGINWLSFLKRFNLHGILCDDMGLGKTLQASAIVASDIAERRATRNSEDSPSSLIICPSTLVGHWVYEIEKFIDASVISPLQYVGSAQERIALRGQFDNYNVIITSYDVVRKDIDSLGQFSWNYCILDEGHIIKNSKSKITGAVKRLKAQHRLVLSGTPIQNNVLDLWSLFDFLMPGFLGTEKQFQATYGKPLVAARDSKCSAKDAEAGALAMEALHKQVMPFLLRRTKDEVLTDLPEKIIQDRYCDLSPVQLKLYEQFSGSHVKQEISSMVKLNDADTGEGNSASPKASSHVFQALQYLLKLCSHPLLVTGEMIPDSLTCHLSEHLPANTDINSELHKLHHSPKLVALQQILEECGIGVDASSFEGSICVGQHRVLIFAQHKAFLDIIEKDLFQVHMKNVTYLRLDGSVEPEKRFDIVKNFNSDPTIDALLLTTHVGGLGLNLTSADTLVFMEHDWNPMRDHQAMDRAHRLGQRKVVNVHRLIMRGTLEEKVMSLQKFKMSVANAVINADNASLKTMNTDQLLDLFTSAESKKGSTASKGSDADFDGVPKSVGGGKGLKAILGGLEELWDQSQYTEEYNLNQFLAKLNG
ncbi:TATA-binding protein-associated factor BTAF1 isoform X2 [Cornus florida]|uniref:TATA-binding protein-associated factor BTAF1 isoform X2 n=1 Tax=Cornus florida TaxID=4283 RepID=UPI00289D70BA|nr:TATA-binding protein-associated factor BTAF1 isoform X2 [Cornus florida]